MSSNNSLNLPRFQACMVYFVLTILSIASKVHAQQVNSSADPTSQIALKDLIIGRWNFHNVEIRCPQSAQLTAQMNEPAAKSFFSITAQQLIHEFSSRGKYLINDEVVDNYTLVNDTIWIGEVKPLQKIKQQNMPENSDDFLSEFEARETYYIIAAAHPDSLVLVNIFDLSRPEFSIIGTMLSMTGDTTMNFKNSTIEIKTTFYPERTTAAQWQEVDCGVKAVKPGDEFSRKMESKNLVCLNDEYICFLRKQTRFNPKQAELYYRHRNDARWKKKNIELGNPNETIESLSISGKFLSLKTESSYYFTGDPAKSFQSFQSLSKEDYKALTSGNSDSVTAKRWQLIPKEKRNFDKSDVLLPLIMAANSSQGEGKTEIYATNLNESDWNIATIKHKDYPGLMVYDLRIMDNVAMLFTQYGNFISKDQGKNWTHDVNSKLKVNISFETMEFETNLSLFSHADHWFAGCKSGVWISDDGGLNWLNANNSELKSGVNSMAILGETLYALDKYDQLWSISVNDIIQHCQSK